ncbi:MAG: polyprenol phosphomannose-dependent alpha 1,6 mannosyltransferase MptB [Pseudonocardia sp.]|nr:polyprenol phosphomannose-dependent alpha 1,6 mannosyltransferase MptB [Pseudonocardia sp.]
MTAQPSPPVPRPATPARDVPHATGTPVPDDGGPEPEQGGVATATQPAPVADRPPERRGLAARMGDPPRKPLFLGLAASVLLLVGGFGGGGILRHDPILTNSPLGFWRYGHGSELATALMYLGVVLMAWAWVLLGREVLAGRVGGRAVLSVSFVWIVPVLLGPPLFTRDVYSYLAQGALPLFGLDPYGVGPEAMPGVFTDNVHYFWQDTPAPYGPLFILLAKAWAWITLQAGSNMIVGVIGMRLLMCLGLVLLVWTLPELTRRLGGRPATALWVVVANPVTVIHLVGGGHNDLLVVGLLAVGSLFALRGRLVLAIVLVTLAMATKASAAVALPFLVMIWAARMEGPFNRRLFRAAAFGIGIFAVTFGAVTLAARVDLGWLPALSAPSMIVNWLSLPTGVGEFVHTAIGGIATLPKQPFINVARVIGGIALAAIFVTQWWRAREGGPDAIRRAGIVLVAVALLSPATLPWYLSWGMALLAMTAWSARGLQWLVFGSLWLVIVYYPNGEAGLYNWGYLAVCAVLAALAAVSLLRPDPLKLGRSRAVPAETRPAMSAEQAESRPARADL